jgi:hypothetical protein
MDQPTNDLAFEAEEHKTNYLSACKTIADMHAAAVGEVRGPIRGVIEDVADMRARMLAAEEALANEQRARAEAERSAELADAVTAETKRLLERRTTTLRERAERAEAALARVRKAVQEFTGGEHPRRAGKTLAGELAARVLGALAEPPGPAATQATEPAESALRDLIAAAIYERNNPGHRWADAHPDDLVCYGNDADAALTVIRPGANITATLARMSEADVQRVIALYERWVKAGPPPLGTSTSRWWDARLVELHDAILPPTDQPKEK